MVKIYKIIISFIVISAIVVGIVFLCLPSNKKVTFSPGKIEKVDTMVELCAIDMFNEMAIVDTVSNWELFAIQKQRGSISFDMENIEIKNNSDTVFITLPKEIIEIQEATDENSWREIDSKNITGKGSDEAPKLVWDRFKKNIIEKSKKDLYINGVVERARKEGAENLQQFMEMVYRKPVIIIDPTPKGSYYNVYTNS